MKKIAVLTCGRSDFSIYLPLLKKLEELKAVELTIIAFGSHTSHYHGYTINEIHNENFSNVVPVDALLSDDKNDSIAISMGLTMVRMSEIWHRNSYDWLVCLGDRYEMFAAVSSALPFNFKVAHLHGGEKTLGAIDNSFRHAISAMSTYHFTSCEAHKSRVQEIIENEFHDRVFNVGALALQNLNDIPLYSDEEFFNKFGVDFSCPTVLVTYHPETVDLEANENNVSELLSVFDVLEHQVLLTLPNNDATGARARERFTEYAKSSSKMYVFDFLGVKGYYSAMRHCTLMLGNSSSGIIEAASFGCRVINVGDRQKGRHSSDNVIHAKCRKTDILQAVRSVEGLGPYNGSNIYYQHNTLELMLDLLTN